MSDPTFWFTILLTTVVLLLPVVAWRFYRSDVHPTLADKVRLLQRHAKIKPKEEFRPFSGRRSRYVQICTQGFNGKLWDRLPKKRYLFEKWLNSQSGVVQWSSSFSSKIQIIYFITFGAKIQLRNFTVRGRF